MAIEADPAERPGEPDLGAAVEGLERRAGVEGHDVGIAVGDEHRVPELADHELGSLPVELEVGVAEPEAVEVGVGRAEELRLDVSRGFGAEGVRAGDLPGQPGLDGQDVEAGLGVDVPAERVEGRLLGVEEEVALADVHGLAGIVEDVGLDVAGE